MERRITLSGVIKDSETLNMLADAFSGQCGVVRPDKRLRAVEHLLTGRTTQTPSTWREFIPEGAERIAEAAISSRLSAHIRTIDHESGYVTVSMVRNGKAYKTLPSVDGKPTLGLEDIKALYEGGIETIYDLLVYLREYNTAKWKPLDIRKEALLSTFQAWEEEIVECDRLVADYDRDFVTANAAGDSRRASKCNAWRNQTLDRRRKVAEKLATFRDQPLKAKRRPAA